MKSCLNIHYYHDLATQPLKVDISVTQQEKILYKRTIDLRCFYSPLRIEFEFDSLDPIELSFSTKDHAIESCSLHIHRIQFDDLMDLPFVAHTGQMTNNTTIDQGNCLYCRGRLVYSFQLPLCSNSFAGASS